ncbi:ribosome-binding factor A [Candidatus Parcubacteria bacterium]|nr:ribosome-binding factor A [Candidatus Parcubacteria bacterium]
MSRMDQINEQLAQELARLINELVEMPDALITVTRVKCSANLREATVMISVLPDNKTGTALSQVKKQNSNFIKHLNKRLVLKNMPRLRWQIDPTERKAEELEQAIKNNVR